MTIGSALSFSELGSRNGLSSGMGINQISMSERNEVTVSVPFLNNPLLRLSNSNSGEIRLRKLVISKGGV